MPGTLSPSAPGSSALAGVRVDLSLCWPKAGLSDSSPQWGGEGGRASCSSGLPSGLGGDFAAAFPHLCGSLVTFVPCPAPGNAPIAIPGFVCASGPSAPASQPKSALRNLQQLNPAARAPCERRYQLPAEAQPWLDAAFLVEGTQGRGWGSPRSCPQVRAEHLPFPAQTFRAGPSSQVCSCARRCLEGRSALSQPPQGPREHSARCPQPVPAPSRARELLPGWAGCLQTHPLPACSLLSMERGRV